MNKLITELKRLYFLHDQQWHRQPLDATDNQNPASAGVLTDELLAEVWASVNNIAFNLVSPDGQVRSMVIAFARAADWEQVAILYQGLQEDLELPAPAISVSGQNGYRLWLSFAEPILVAEAQDFLAALRCQYMADIPLSKIQLCPDNGTLTLVDLVPARHAVSGKWSAFIDPSMGAMFSEGSGLEMAPNLDRQADMLAGLASIKAADFQQARRLLQTSTVENTPEAETGQDHPGIDRSREMLNIDSHFTDPKTFLLAVMNNPSVSAGQRIKAAKALLPYCKRTDAK